MRPEQIVSATFTQPEPKLYRFCDIAVGDFVVSPTTHISGIKIGDRSIRFFDPTRYSTHNICFDVGKEWLYNVPRTVQVTVVEL